MESGKSTTDVTSRREFLRGSCSALAILGFTSGSVLIAGCDSGGSSGEETLPDGVTREGNTLTVDLTQFPDLQDPKNSLWIPAANVIVIHDSDIGYRAFNSVCPHEGEDVRIYEASGGDDYQLRCPAHDWTFDEAGRPTGKSEGGISQFPLTKDGNILRITLDS